ncbi:hypothetical protein [Pseudonocardia humida]|uniref:Lipoprotein n=1 Tax=Pseudonocardia humida TaxID=2800819 RepID=A0ABT1AAW0_9PSEU|nr:hypothetical protein [Pseudonocardia humida]MCO1660078.1 hypothetical protein [Pseudonocardia humida]
MAIALLALLAACGTTEAAAPSVPAAPAPPAPEPGVVFAEDFDGDRLDETRWAAPDRADLIHQRDGGLNLVVTAQDTADGVEAALNPRFTGSFRELRFTVAVPDFGESGPGGPAVVVRQASGRNHELAFGPSGGELQAVALVCGRPECAAYDDFAEPTTSAGFARGEVVPARIVQDGPVVRFFLRDQLIGESAADDDSPLTAFDIELYGADGEAWHVVLDALRLTA